MEVRSLCPFRTSSLVFQPREGSFALAVIAKITYRLVPGLAVLARDQLGIQVGDTYCNDDPGQSLDRPSDLVPFKPRVDVVVVGSVFAPQRKPVRSLVARLVVAELDKSIEVFCARTIGPDGAIREGMRLISLPIRYEYTAGGPNTWNPVGVRSGALPQIVPPGVSSADGSGAPIGFGPIAPGWPLRRDKLGGRPAPTDFERQPLGDPFDAGYFQSAPRDQQIQALRPDERIALENLHTEHPLLVTNLPGLLPRAFADLGAGPASNVPMRADTLWIDTDRALCTVTYRGQVPLTQPGQAGTVYVLMQEPGQTLGWADVMAKLWSPDGTVSDSWLGTPGSLVADPKTQPLVADPKTQPLVEDPKTEVLAADPKDKSFDETQLIDARAENLRKAKPVIPFEPDTTMEIRADSLSAQRPVMPFAQATGAPVLRSAPVAPPPSPPLENDHDTTREMPSGAVLGQKAVMPFAGSPPATPALVQSKSAIPFAAPPMAPPPMIPPPAVLPPVVEKSEKGEKPLQGAESIELIWFESSFVPRIRKHPAWAPLCKAQAPVDAPEEALGTDVSSVLSRAAPNSAEELKLGEGASGNDHDARLFLLAGTLAFPLDDVECLRATARTAAPLAPVDKKLKEVLDIANEVLKTPLEGAPETAQSFVQRIREAWTNANRLLPPDHLVTHTERTLLSQRHYQKRQLLDDEWIRALYTPPGSNVAIPAYVPAKLSKRLPLFRQFQARLVALVLPRQDMYESHPIALRALALARVLGGETAAEGRSKR